MERIPGESPMKEKRYEYDSMGKMTVPSDALYGAQTARAIENFPISDLRFPRSFIFALGLIKREAAKTNRELGLIENKIAEAIIKSADEVMKGDLDEHFIVDIFQTGSGTSTNMNVNEVIANRAKQILHMQGESVAIHPNDHVNFGQSSNDVIPTAMHVAIARELELTLLPSLTKLQALLVEKEQEFNSIVKIGRTHLQDATPIRLGQVFSGFARQVTLAMRRLQTAQEGLLELALGGTAVGTGINTHPDFASTVILGISQATNISFTEATNHFEAQAAKDAVVMISAALKNCAVSLYKIANDIRHLGSGPRCGLGELILPPVQPGSSIMPGKVNPVMAESLLQVCAQVVGNDATVTLGGLSGNFELNVMMPVMVYNVLQSVDLLASGVEVFSTKLIQPLQADKKRCTLLIEKSLAMCTALAPVIGYDNAAQIAKEAFQTGRTIREVVHEKNILTETELEKILNPTEMTHPGIAKRIT